MNPTERRLEGRVRRLGERGEVLAARRIEPGDLGVCDGRFGRGLRRDAAAALAGLGLSAVVAREFDSRFLAAALEAGLLLVADPRAAEELAEGNRARVDVETALVHDLSTDEWYRGAAPPRTTA
jgi:3-isopropylmalate/(R)-2-methylmalate dehydratase small subunit